MSDEPRFSLSVRTENSFSKARAALPWEKKKKKGDRSHFASRIKSTNRVSNAYLVSVLAHAVRGLTQLAPFKIYRKFHFADFYQCGAAAPLGEREEEEKKQTEDVNLLNSLTRAGSCRLVSAAAL